MSREGALEGYVTRYDPRGWLELTNFKHEAGPEVRQNVLVFVFELESCRDSRLDCSLVGSFVVISEVHAIKLWGSLGGFTTGPRSTISQFPHLRRKRSRREVDPGPLPWCGGISTGLCSHKCILFLLWQALSCGRVRSGGLAPTLSFSDGAFERVLAAVLRDVDHSPFDVSAEGEPTDAVSDFIFYKIRAGNDQDWLCSLLPEVINTRHVVKLARKMCGREKSSRTTEYHLRHGDYRSRVGLCGRRNKEMELLFSACVVGSLTSIDVVTGKAVITDSTGVEMIVYASGDMSRVMPGEWLTDIVSLSTERQLMLVVSQPLVLCEEMDGAPTTTVILAEASKMVAVDLGDIEQYAARPLTPTNHQKSVGCIYYGGNQSTAGGRAAGAATMSVRRALTVNPQGTPDWCCVVVGVVVFKESVVSGYPLALEGPSSDLSGQKVLLTLRDCNYSDKISVFVESVSAVGAIVGCIVCVHRCTLKWNKSHKNVYIDCDIRKGSKIGK